jgi:predicted RNase H-like nuclease (RuvC/YqgF family)
MNETKAKEYKSPRRKLVKFFEKSRDQWKIKCSDAKAMVKRQNNRIRFLEASKEQWKTKAIELEKELARMKAQANQKTSQQAVKKTMK